MRAVKPPSRKILVADDEIHIVCILALKFRQEGYEVLTAEDGRQALEMARLERPDMVITDYHMPYLNGLDLARCLKKDSALREIPVVLLTGRGLSLTPEMRSEAGIAHCIYKPFSPRQLLTWVEGILEPLAV